MTVTELFIKYKPAAPMQAVNAINCSPDGIAGGVRCAPFRQSLIVSRSVTAACGLKPGDLRENIVIDVDDLYDLPSGTVVQIGQAKLRLTFHCEPCRKLLHLIDFARVEHRRGVFGTFLNSATISVGDRFAVTGERMEAIPYAVPERIRWHLRNHGVRGTVNLVDAIGLPPAYGRAMPRLVAKFLGGAN